MYKSTCLTILVSFPTPEGLPVTVEHRRFSGTPEVELDNYHHNQ